MRRQGQSGTQVRPCAIAVPRPVVSQAFQKKSLRFHIVNHTHIISANRDGYEEAISNPFKNLTSQATLISSMSPPIAGKGMLASGSL